MLDGSQGSAVVRLPLVVSLDPDDSAIAKIRRGAVEQAATSWFHDETRQPAMAADVAPAIWKIAQLERGHRSGVWHLPGPERLSRYEIARRVVAALGLDPNSIISSTSPNNDTRPRHINMLGDRARSQVSWRPAPVLL